MLFGFHSTFAIFCVLLVISLPEPNAAQATGDTPGGGDATAAAGGNSEAAPTQADASPAAQQAAVTSSQVPPKAKSSPSITLPIGLETISLFLALYLGV
ncbi:hypothetical protein TELCIR_21926 [Teladorsagia circumcincta]|uniref:Preprotein translocase subunit SecG domain protein n=1 Tax=Teladorsagia circumcincta TaxID=45464 RepID=A0A2G9TFC8_TELCI|nr:hypothetical protein TELCIR_21926 [Teladorsagia circumcincta]